MITTQLWVSTRMSRGQVNIDSSNVIVSAPSIWAKFIGQDQNKLWTWFAKYLKVEVTIKPLNKIK